MSPNAFMLAQLIWDIGTTIMILKIIIQTRGPR